MAYIGDIHKSCTDQIGRFIRELIEAGITVTMEPSPSDAKYIMFLVPDSVPLETARYFHGRLNDEYRGF
jgi:hypothetical protein